MKARNILIILAVQYLLIVFLSGVLELMVIGQRAKEVKSVLMSSADMALEQIQLVDDFLGYGNNDSLLVSFPSRNGTGFVKEDLFLATTGFDSRNDHSKMDIFNYLYNSPTSNDLRILANRASGVRIPVRYWNGFGGMSWYTIPALSLMGTDLFGAGSKALSVKDAQGSPVANDKAASLYEAYGLNSITRLSGDEEYYNTPLNTGVTYLNKDLLSKLFINNVDHMMREKYSTQNLNSPEGGNGILVGSTYNTEQLKDMSTYNPINNGSFSVLRGTEFINNASVSTFTGVTPTVEYKVIDMYDPANDNMLSILFGGNKGSFPTKARYLWDLDKHINNPITNAPYTSKPIVVAKVTFYLDVVIPYFSLTNREFRKTFNDGEHMFDIQPTAEDTNIDGARRISYTRFFAVTP